MWSGKSIFRPLTLVQLSSVQFKKLSMRSKRADNYALHLISQKFPQRCLCNGSTVRLIDDGPFLSFEGRSSRASSFHASLLQAIDSVMSLALSPQVVSQASQHFRSSEKQVTDVESEKRVTALTCWEDLVEWVSLSFIIIPSTWPFSQTEFTERSKECSAPNDWTIAVCHARC